MDQKRLMTIGEVGRELGRSPRSVRHIVEQGGLSAVLVGGSVRIRRDVLERFIAELPEWRPGRNRRLAEADRIAAAA